MPAGNDKESAEAVLSAGFAGKYGDRISNRSLEKLVLSRAIRRHTGHRILVYGNRAVVFD